MRHLVGVKARVAVGVGVGVGFGFGVGVGVGVGLRLRAVGAVRSAPCSSETRPSSDVARASRVAAAAALVGVRAGG